MHDAPGADQAPVALRCFLGAKKPLQMARSLIYMRFHSDFNLRLVNADAFTWPRSPGSQPITEEKKD